MFPKTNTIQENYDHYHEIENLSDVDPHLNIYSIENQIQESLEGLEEPLTEPLTELFTEPPSMKNSCTYTDKNIFDHSY